MEQSSLKEDNPLWEVRAAAACFKSGVPGLVWAVEAESLSPVAREDFEGLATDLFWIFGESEIELSENGELGAGGLEALARTLRSHEPRLAIKGQ